MGFEHYLRSGTKAPLRLYHRHLRGAGGLGRGGAAAHGQGAGALALMTPKGLRWSLPERTAEDGGPAARCAVRKDAGDDPDVTDGVLVYADVRWAREPGIRIDGGEGVGRVTKPGLDQPVGAAAINSVPRRMIRSGGGGRLRPSGYAAAWAS